MRFSHRAMYASFNRLFLLVFTSSAFFLGLAVALPPDFSKNLIISDLKEPASIGFSPDGRLFFGERIEGNIRIVNTNGQLLTQPFLTLDVPNDGNGNPVRHRSAGIRGFAFDPNYDTNGYIYIFYMKQFPGGVRHNRVSRFQADPTNADVALAGSETVLLEVPFQQWWTWRLQSGLER